MTTPVRPAPPTPARPRRRPERAVAVTTAVLALSLALLVALVLLAMPVPRAAADETPAPDPALAQTVTGDETTAQGPAVVDAGHVDVGPRLVDGQWRVMARDDSGSEPVWRDPDELVLRVRDTALMDAPTDEAYSFMGASAGERWYVIPQTQNQDVVWLGWNTQDPGVVDVVDRGATMSVGAVQGPGKSWLFLQNGTFGQPLLLVDGQKDAPQDVWVDANTHVHANWVFTAPGVYTARLTFSADTKDGRHETATTTLRFAVGDATSTDEALAAPAPTGPSATPSTTASGATTGGASATASAGSAATLESAGTDDGVGGVRTAAVTIAVLALAAVVGAVLITRRHRAVAAERAQAHEEESGGE